MLRSGTEDELAGNHQVVLVLRLVLDRYAELRYGEVLDAEAVGQGRFFSLPELADAVQRWLELQRGANPWGGAG